MDLNLFSKVLELKMMMELRNEMSLVSILSDHFE
jgi:hypothetical protein